jgi:hypothetical protein
MPKNKEYNKKNVGTGASQTPANIMGSQGKSANLPKPQHVSRPTSNTPFPGEKASGRGVAPNHKSKKY